MYHEAWFMWHWGWNSDLVHARQAHGANRSLLQLNMVRDREGSILLQRFGSLITSDLSEKPGDKGTKVLLSFIWDPQKDGKLRGNACRKEGRGQRVRARPG